MRRFSPLAFMFALGATGCASEASCEGDACACSSFASDGTCCNGFLELGDDGLCVARAWPPVERHHLGDADASAIEVSVDGLGYPLVTWHRRHPDAALARAHLAERTADGWVMHTLGDPALGFGSRATIATRGLEAWVAWSQHRVHNGADESSVHLLRRDARGDWLSSDVGQQLSFPPKAYEPRPLLPGTGEHLLVWNQWRSDGGYGVALARQDPETGALEGPSSASDVLSAPVFFSNAPQIAVADNGDGVITWYQATPGAGSQSEGLRLFVSERARLDGAFTRPSIDEWISPEGPPLASHLVRNPVVAIGDFGDALLFWSQEHPSGATGLFSASRDGLGVWTTPTDIDDTFGPLREDAACIEVHMSPTGEAHVTWFDGPPGATTVYTARRSRDGAWDEPRTHPVSTEGRPAQDPRLAVGPVGEVAVVWSERGGDGRWRVMARRRGPLSQAWGAAVELSDPTEGDALGPAIAIGPDGTLVAAWGVGPIGEQTVSLAVLP